MIFIPEDFKFNHIKTTNIVAKRLLKEGEKQKPNNQFCEFVRPLRFRVGNGYNGEDTGFFLPGCKDYKKEERKCLTCLHFLPSEDSNAGECRLYSDRAYSHYLCNDWKSKN